MIDLKTKSKSEESSKSLDDFLRDKAEKRKKATQKYDFDRLKMYFGEPYTVTDNLVVYEPTIGQILEFGESEFYGMLNVWIAHPTQYRVKLWDMGIDWNKISDFELFCSLSRSYTPDKTHLIFKDVDWSKFKTIKYDLSEEQVKINEEHKGEKDYQPIEPKMFLVSEEQSIIIDEKAYSKMAEYLRTMFNIFPKVEKAKGKATKEALIEDDRGLYAKKDDDNKSFLLPLISSCINHPGFKYKLQELKDVGIVEFMDSVQRLQVYESTKSLMGGMYSGFADMSKVDKKLFNFMRDLDS